MAEVMTDSGLKYEDMVEAMVQKLRQASAYQYITPDG